MNNNLILRIENSPYGDVTKGSVLSQAELDGNFIFLKGNSIYTAITNDNTVTLKTYNGKDITFQVSGGSGNGNSWSLTGNSGTDPMTNFIGTTDANAFIIGTNGIGHIGIGDDGSGTITNADIYTQTGDYSVLNWGDGIRMVLYRSDNYVGLVGIDEAGVSIEVNAGGGIIFLDALTNNVGIGTNTPSEKLEINGSFSSINGDYRQINTSLFKGLVSFVGGAYDTDYSTFNTGNMLLNGIVNFGSVLGVYRYYDKTSWTGSIWNRSHGLTLNSSLVALSYITDETNNYNHNVVLQNSGVSVKIDDLVNSASTFTVTTNDGVALSVKGDGGNVGIGTANPASKLTVTSGDIEITDIGSSGIIMYSPDGTKYRITVANGGTLTVTPI